MTSRAPSPSAPRSASALVARAPGKVNLCLFVGHPGEDGLHPLVSLVQPVSLADVLRLEPAPSSRRSAGVASPIVDEVVCPGVLGPNLAAHALALYREHSGWDAPAQRLTIRKSVPVAAGMGGGSGDAAAALRLAAHAAGRPEDPLLAELAPLLGADVPAQVSPARALVGGVGEEVEPLGPGGPLGLVIVPSAAALSTPVVYRRADALGSPRPPADLEPLAARVRAAARGSTSLLAELCVNDLEPAARSLVAGLEATSEALRRVGAECALVSGSGPTVFGTFPGADGPGRAGEAAARLRAAYPRVVVAVPVEADFGVPHAVEVASR